MKAGKEQRMKESYREGLASHPGPESCAGVREDAREALTGAHAGAVLSLENVVSWGADAVPMAEGNTAGSEKASIPSAPRGLRPDACVEALCTEIGRSRGFPSRRKEERDGGGRSTIERSACTSSGSRTVA